MTNNPRKTDLLTKLGVAVAGRIACRVVDPFEASLGYLKTKERRMNHVLDAAKDKDGEALGGELDGSWCFVDHSGA